ncbi:MAG: hypothetical protein ISS49_04935 [Anaerolineae bacterium]|nr:hypothetical protein [Anaerolineae bacterium]
MCLFEGFERVRLVKTGPPLKTRLEWWIARWHHRITIARLRHFRRMLEQDMAPEEWTLLEAPAVLLLAEVCNTLALSEEERADVLGPQGVRALAEILESRAGLGPEGERMLAEALVTRAYPEGGVPVLNERQNRALLFVEKHGSINLAAYRQLCPDWCDETLRLDLGGLVRQGLLSRNGRNKGTYYTAASF